MSMEDNDFLAAFARGRSAQFSFNMSDAAMLRMGHPLYHHPDTNGVAFAQRQLTRFTYKPGWKFSIDALSGFLAITFKTEDTYHPGNTIEIGGHRSLSATVGFGEPDEDRFAHELAHHIHDLEIHEAREWLRRDGEIFDNPHDPRPR